MRYGLQQAENSPQTILVLKSQWDACDPHKSPLLHFGGLPPEKKG